MMKSFSTGRFRQLARQAVWLNQLSPDISGYTGELMKDILRNLTQQKSHHMRSAHFRN